MTICHWRCGIRGRSRSWARSDGAWFLSLAWAFPTPRRRRLLPPILIQLT